MPNVLVAGDPWVSGVAVQDGYANTSVIVRGDGWTGAAVASDGQANTAVLVLGDAWLSAVTISDLTPLVEIRVPGDGWSVGLVVSEGVARRKTPRQGESASSTVVASDGVTKRKVPFAGQAWTSASTGADGVPRRKLPVAGEAWSSSSVGVDGTAKRRLPKQGDSSVVVAGAFDGIAARRALRSGTHWTVGAGAFDGAALTQVVVRGELWPAAASARDGTVVIKPETPWIDTESDPQGAYRYLVFDVLTDELLTEVQMSDVSFTNKIAAAGDLGGTVYAVDSQPDVDLYWATMPMKTAIYVLRGDRALWGGIIWNREYDLVTKQVKISAGSWESYLFRRYIWHTFETSQGSDQYDVVRQLLTKMRNDFYKDYTVADGVTPLPMSAALDIYSDPNAVAGRTQDSILFSREELQSFGDALQEYANNENGFEWYFRVDYNKTAKRFRRRLQYIETPPALMAKGSDPLTNTEADKPGIDTFLFEYPGNIITVTLIEDADNAATRQFVMGGPPEGITLEGFKPVGAWNNTTYTNKGFPLVENVESSKHATEHRPKRLKKLAKIYGQESSPPLRRWSIVVNGSMDPIVGTYRVGHWCRLIINDPFVEQSLELAGQNQQSRGVIKRIVGITVDVPTGPQLPETVTLELEDDVVTTWEPAETIDENGNPLPAAPITLYPTGNLIGESSGNAGAPKINGSSKQWSDSSSDTWGQLTSWQSGTTTAYAANALRSTIPAATVSATGRTVYVKLNLQAVDAGTFHPYSAELRHKGTGEVCLIAYPQGITSINPKFLQWSTNPVGGGVANFQSWLAAGDLELRVEAGRMPGPVAGGDRTYRMKIFEARIVIS